MENLSKLTLIFLHGFGGGPSDYDELISHLPLTLRVKCLTLSGHETQGPVLPLEEEISKLTKEFAREENLVLCGYSMGGRLACLLSEKLKLKGLILLSSGLGGEGPERLTKDQEWAKLLKNNKEEFWKRWYEQKLFASLKNLPQDKWLSFLKKKDKHNALKLAEALEQFSPAHHKTLLPLLKNQKHFLYLAGSLDTKYAGLAELIKNEIPQAQTALIPSAGHHLPLEAPTLCAQHIHEYLLSLSL